MHTSFEGGAISTDVHVEKVTRVVRSRSAAARSRLAASWTRSMVKHGLDPAETRLQELLDDSALRIRQERLDRLLRVAGPRLDRLFSLVGGSGCGVLLTDRAGVVVDQRLSDADAPVFRDWRLWQGADWSERAEGTNGIGTCLAEDRAVIVHRDEHFLARNTAMSCIDAPIYGPEGEIVAALDVSSARADQTEAINALIGAMVCQTAGQIESETFRVAFPGARIVVAGDDPNGGAMLVAVDSDDIVVGATRAARRALGFALTGRLPPVPASDIFGRSEGPTGFKRAERAAVMRALARAGGNVSQAARALGVGRATLYRRMKRLGIGG